MADDPELHSPGGTEERWRRALERQPELRRLTEAPRRSRTDVEAAANRLGLHMAAKRAAGYSAIGYTIAQVRDCSMTSLGFAVFEQASQILIELQSQPPRRSRFGGRNPLIDLESDLAYIPSMEYVGL
jgi:hypothetical protein